MLHPLEWERRGCFSLVFLTGLWSVSLCRPLPAPLRPLWAPQGFRPPTSRTWRSSTAWRSPSATSSTSYRTSTRPGSPSPLSWTWTLRSPWRPYQTAPSPRWRSCTRPPTLSAAPSALLNRHQRLISQEVSYYRCSLLSVWGMCRIWVETGSN